MIELTANFCTKLMTKAIFLDRDGVIIELPKGNEAYGFIYKKEDVRILPGVVEALKTLKNKNYLLIVVTNQPLIARGLANEEEIKCLHDFINTKVDNLVDRFYVCPHHPEMHDDVPLKARKYRIVCDCRKPAPGMIFQAKKDFNIDLKHSWMIGDMIIDIAAGDAAGLKTIMIKSLANERVPKSGKPFNGNVKPTAYASHLLDATQYIE